MIAPNDDPAVAAAEAALKAQDFGRALDLARAALDRGVIHPLLFNLRAYGLEHAGRLAEARADLERALALAPEDAGIVHAIGLNLARSGLFQEAVAAFDKAIVLQPHFLHAQTNRAYALESLNDLDGARAAYEQVVALDPRAAEPMARLAMLAVQRADWKEARARAESSLALDPVQTAAVIALATLETAEGTFAPAEDRVIALLQRQDLLPNDRYNAMGLLANIYDRQGRTAEAFNAYASGNEAFKRIHAGRFSGAQTALDVVGWLTAYFEKARVHDWTPAPDDMAVPHQAEGHVFLVGFPRSGTTLLEQTLASHPDVLTMEEREALADSAREFLTNADGLDRLRMLPAAECRHYVESYWNRVAGFGFDVRGKVFVDKLPFNTLKLPLVARFFPKAKVLFAVRDPRDVIWSCFRQRFRMNAYMYELLTLDGAARFYDAYMRLWELYRTHLPLAARELRHEDVVASFDSEISAVCNFLGIEWNAAMADFGARVKVRTSATPNAARLTEGLTPAGIGQWRRYAAQLSPILPVVAPWVKRFGYAE